VTAFRMDRPSFRIKSQTQSFKGLQILDNSRVLIGLDLARIRGTLMTETD